mmetsp:Transcript_11358/g.30608  ORF Transcript_11358/g.30608 Transcript_11358/m.30608 type:complete len:87 (-) Transcript_11358:30-290(-)
MLRRMVAVAVEEKAGDAEDTHVVAVGRNVAGLGRSVMAASHRAQITRMKAMLSRRQEILTRSMNIASDTPELFQVAVALVEMLICR